MVAGMDPITVALDARLVSGQFTGDTTYWEGLIHGLMRTNSSIRYLLYSNAPRPANIPKSDRFAWIELPGSNRWWSLVRFPLRARRDGANIIHTQYSLSPLVGTLGVTTVHDVSFFINPRWFRPRDRVLLQATVPAAAKRARRIITVSETSRGEIEHFIRAAKGKTVAIHNAAGLNVRKMDPKESQRLVQKLGIEGPFLLTIGTRWPRKNLALAIQAAEGMSQAYNHRIVVAGKVGWGDEASGGRVLTPGYVDDEMLSALYSSASLYLVPSWHEGFGVTVLEAFRCGCPVVSSAGGALPEVVSDAGVIVDSWEPEVWTERLQNLLCDSSKLDLMRTKGIERESTFSWEKSAAQHEQVYREATR